MQVYHLQSALEREREDGYHCDLLVGKRIICRAKEYMAMLNAADARRCQCSLLLHNKTPSDRMQVPVSLMIAKEDSQSGNGKLAGRLVVYSLLEENGPKWKVGDRQIIYANGGVISIIKHVLRSIEAK